MLCKPFKGKQPNLYAGCYVAENATIVGDVTIMPGASIWYNAVLRGDYASIAIGENTNLQEGVTAHCDRDATVVIGSNVTVGHHVLLHGCTVGNNCIIGMGAILMNNCQIGEGCIIAAGSVVTQNAVIPQGSLVMGAPAKVKRVLGREEELSIEKSAQMYLENAREHFDKV